nr:retrovirus-related Pol polyprotein from transposon TNT 1-94 [Tanacetum cinerariifolium]
MTTLNVTSSTDSQMHNNIMAVGSRDRQPTLAPGRYPQWRSRFLRYVDIRPNVPEHTTVETPMNMSPENKAHFEAKMEAIHLILTGIRDEIYSTEFGKFTSQDGESMESYYTRFYKLMNEMIRNNLTVTTMQVNVQFLQQLQPEWSRLARNANPLTLVATAHANQDPHYQTSSLEDKDIQNNLALIAKYFKKIYKPTNNNLRTSSNSKNKNVNTTPRFKNDNQSGQYGNQRTINVVAARENVRKSQKGLRTSRSIRRRCCCVNKLSKVFHYKQNADSGTDSESVEQVQNDAGYNVFANHLQPSEQFESTEFEKYKAFNDRTIDYDKLKRKLNEALEQLAQKDTVIREGLKTKAYEISVVKQKHDELMKQSLLTKSPYEEIVDNAWIKHSKDQYRAPTAQDMEILIQTCLMPLANKTHNDGFKFVYELKQEMHADLLYVESLEKEIDELKSDKAEFSDMYDVILQECVSKDVMCSYLQSLSDLDALAELQCMYLHKVKECDCLAQKLSKQTESVSKKDHTELLQRFAKVEKHLIFLEIALQECKEQALPQAAKKAVSNTNVLKPRMYRIDNRKVHTRAPQLPQTVRNTNPRVSTSTGVNHTTYVSRLQLKSNQSRDKVLPNNSQVKIVQLILFIVDFGFMKHMTGNLKLLCNFVEKFLGTLCFGNDQFAPILGYGDLVQGNVTINRVYYVEGLNHNLFSVGQFCDANLEVAFRKSTCFVRDLQGNDLLTNEHVPSQQEFDLLLGPLYDEVFNAGSNPQDKQPSMNILSTSAPSTHTTIHAEENNNDQAEEGEHLQDDEFTNPFCALTQEEAESSSHDIEKVRGNPSRPVQTRRQLATDPEICMYALTVSTAESKNIKEAMADSAWIEAMQEELHHTQVFSNLSDGRENNISQWSTYVAQPDGFVDPKHPEKVYRLEKALYGLKQAPRAWYDKLSKFLTSKGFTKGQSIGTPMATKPKLDADLSGNPVDQTDYRSKIGSLMYLTSSRPDIVQVGSSLELTTFSDAGHAGCIYSRKITSRGIQFLGDKLVSWMSKKQNCTAMSSAEAEYVALSASCAQSAIAISYNPVRQSHTKHIHTRYHFIKEQVKNGIIELYFVRTEYQLADMFTKALPEDRFRYLVRRIGMRCLTPAKLEVLAKESA